MKKVCVIFLMLSMIFSLSACGLIGVESKEKIKETAKETVGSIVEEVKKEVKEDIVINKDNEDNLESISLHKIGITVEDIEKAINNEEIFKDGILFIKDDNGVRYDLLKIENDEIEINVQAFKEAKDNKVLNEKMEEVMGIFKDAIKEFIASEKVQNGKAILDDILEDIEDVTTDKDSPLYSPILDELKKGEKQ